MRTAFVAALMLGAIGFAQGQSGPAKEPTLLSATATAIQEDDGTIRFTKLSLTFGGATLTAEDAIWHKAANEIEFRGNARLKLERVNLRPVVSK